MKHRPIKPPNFSLGIVQPKENNLVEEPAKITFKVDTGDKRISSKISRMVGDTMSRMQEVEEAAERNRQSINVDLFLEQQKQKRIEYAKNLNEQFEKQRKLRQKKLYKSKQEQKEPRKKYLNEMPNLRKHIFDPTSDDPFILMTHNLGQVGEFITELDFEELRKAEIDKLKQQQQLQWETIYKLADDSTKVKFATLDKQGIPILKGDIMPSDGAEQLVNAIVLLSTSQIIYNTLVISKQELTESKIHAFRLYKQGQPCTVPVDGNLQCIKYENNIYVAHARCNNPNTFWLSLFVKAYKRLTLLNQLQLRRIPLVQILPDLAPIQVEVVKFNKQALIASNFMTVLDLLVKNQSIVALYRQGNISKSNSYQERLYPVKMVSRNKQLKNCRVELLNPWKGKQLKTDGKDQLTYEDILANFNRLIVVKGMPSDWAGFMFHSNFFSNGLPSSSNTEWTRNNQHSLVVSKPTYVRICMKPQEVMAQQFGFMLFRADNHETMISSMNLERLLLNAKSANANGASCTLYIDKGCYFVVPYTHQRSYDSYVFFRFELFMSSMDAVTMMKTRHIDIKYRNISTDKEKMLVDMEDKEIYEKQRTDKILEIKSKSNKILVDHVNIQQVAASGLQHPRLEQFFMPGMLYTFIVRQGVHVQEEIHKEHQSEERPEILMEEWNQIYKHLIGVDAYTDEVNRGQMDEALDMLDQSVDLANFQLGDDGFQTLLQPIMDQPIIRSLNVSGNCLTDKTIICLCYYLEKTGHTELQSMDVSHNNIGQVGYKSLLGLKDHMPVLKTIEASHNPNITRDMVRNLRQDISNKVIHK